MQASFDESRRARIFSLVEIGFIIFLALVPLFLTFPYRVNIFLSWEGAYRLSQGQLPYRDFGMPLGYMYWVIPAFFFKLFGAQLITLIKAQVFINILSGLAFRSILKSLGVQPGARLLSVLLFCISYSFFNFWPWYNHTVIVYQLIGLAFLFRYCTVPGRHWLLLSVSALFTFFSFFTKQDAGGLALLLAVALLVFHSVQERSWRALLIFCASYTLIAVAIILPLTRFGFGYWFNHGQPPHTARISLIEIADEFFISSQWIKFYLFLIIIILIAWRRNIRQWLMEKQQGLFLLLTLGVLAEAAVLQVTSYTPPDNNIFFHSFAFAFILASLARLLSFNLSSLKILAGCFAGLLIWWSGIFWKYAQRIVQRMQPDTAAVSAGGENVVNRKTYMIAPPTKEIPQSQWTFSALPSFKKVYMPGPTVDGIDRVVNKYRTIPGQRVLNMTELTPLVVEMKYPIEKGREVPLWYHLGVAMFNKEAAMYESRILNNEYGLVLFEYIPTLNNFYPFRVRDTLMAHYQKIDSFPAPRRGEETQGMIEVYQPR